MIANLKKFYSLTCFLLILSKVNSYCNPTTTTHFITTGGFTGNLNQVRVGVRTMYVPTSHIVPTIQMDTCKTTNGMSQSCGIKNYFYNQSEPFNIQFSDLNSMSVYSQQNVNAFIFNYSNGSSKTYGNPIGSLTIIDLQNKDVVAVNVYSYYWIESVQFLIFDQQLNTYLWTNMLGLPGGNSFSMNADKIKHASKFKFISIYGSADDNVVNQIQFSFTYDICNPYKTGPTIPPIPVLPPATSTATTSTLSTMKKSVAFDSCEVFTDQSIMFGTIDTLFLTMSYDVQISDLKSIEVLSGDFVYALNFTSRNGNSVFCGNYVSKKIKRKTLIDLENRQLVALHLRSGLWINNIQFLIYDPFVKKYSWTDALGGQGGVPAYIDAQTVAPLSSEFQITSLSGSGNPAEEIRTLKVGYSYKQCNPAVPGVPIPLAPALSSTTKILPSQTTVYFENLVTSTHS